MNCWIAACIKSYDPVVYSEADLFDITWCGSGAADVDAKMKPRAANAEGDSRKAAR